MLYGAKLQRSCSNFYTEFYYLVCGIVECLAKFMQSMINSKNSTVRIIAHFLATESAVFAENSYCRYLMYKYDISVFAWYGSPYDVMNYGISRTFKICPMNMLAI